MTAERDDEPRLPVAVEGLAELLATHPDGEEIGRVVTGNLARMAGAYAQALEPVPAPKPTPFLDGCRQVDGTWLHGRDGSGAHTCPKWARG